MSRLCNSCLHSNLDVAFYCAKCGTKIFSNSSNKDKPKKEENIDKNRGNKTPTFRWRIVVFIFLVIALFIFLVINKQKVQSPRNYSISEDVKPIEGEEKNTLTNKFSLDVRAIPYDSKIQILNISQPYEKYMMLDKGDYHILVSKKGYKTFDKWITVDKNVYVDANLEQVAIVVNEISKKVQRSEGRVLYAKCAGCHGVDGKTKAFGKSAVIAGQSIADLETKLRGYKAGTINSVGFGSLMKGLVSSSSDDDIKAISAYISRDLTSIESSKFLLEKKEATVQIFSLKVNRIPLNSRVRILNIKPKYYDGIKLKKGKYHIEVSKKGYETIDKWISLKENENFNFELKKIKKNISPKVIKDQHIFSNDSYVSSKVIKYEDPIKNYSVPKQMSKKERKNYNDCLTGQYPSLCKHGWLTSQQAILVKKSERRVNYNNCLTGQYPSLCKHGWLTSQQAILVKKSERRVNYNNCLTGQYPSLCKHSWLTSQQAILVKKSERRVNYNNCSTGQYPSLCKHNWLTSQQANEVRIAENREGN